MEDVKQRKEDSRRKTEINNTKIKYILVTDTKIYKIKKISFFYMEIEGVETDLTVDNVPEDETWDLEEFKNYKVKLVNGSGKAEIVDFSDWVNGRK